ncbi:MAG: hypothetical protein A3K19_28740 [Lentisphaerae bacterium RIFOXYB12_FULL_65_16]|nr:MAG: hypothetical protein A3K18_01450 [Lentisphaerae bacterium RIFOXYA12_64_32]OGV88267.1 MAG: hypothetical protein A3K19_28740 [Lentisphaerae bacterium RIFOXYB12_FULL_65_16]
MVRSFALAGGVLILASAALAAEFEAPPAPFQTVPRPADGEILTANPPCFVYPAKNVAPAYVVEYSRNAQFPPAATVRVASPYMLAVPPQALTSGEYHWRWRPGTPDDGATEWSTTRRFVVPADAPVVPFPDIPALAQRLNGVHPRIMVPPGGLEELRRQALAKFGSDWSDAVRKNAEAMSAKPLLPEPEFLPDTKDPTRTEKYQKTFQTTRPFFRDMANLAQDYLLSGNELAGQEAKRRFLHIMAWDPKGSTRLNHNDEVGTEVIRFGPTVLDRIRPLLSDDEMRRAVDCLLIRMQEMRERWRQRPFEKHPYESHNMMYYLPDLFEASLALVGDAAVEEMVTYTMLQLWSPYYPPCGGADGGWYEGPAYWTWAVRDFCRVYRLAELMTGLPAHRRSNLAKAAAYKLYDNPPYFRMSPFGDGQEGAAIGGETMACLAALYADPYAKWYAEFQKVRLSGVEALFYDADSVAARSPADLPQGHAFRDVGLAAMHTALPNRSDNVTLLLRSCPFGSISHSYADQNAIAFFAYGEPLIIASGYYQLYGCPHHAQWTWQTKASSSVLVNGEGQAIRNWDARGRLTAFYTTVAGDYAVGDAHEAYPGRLSRFSRRIVFLRPIHTGGAPIVVIRDELAAVQPATYQFLFHALRRMDVDTAQQRVTIANGTARCRIDFLAPQVLTFNQTDVFTPPPLREAPNQWHLTAGTTTPAATAESLIVIQPYRDGEAGTLLTPKLETGDGAVGVVLSDAGRTIAVAFRTDPAAARVRLGEIVTDGQAASLSTVNNAPRAAVLFGGTTLCRAETTLIQSSLPTAACGATWGRDRRLVDSDGATGSALTVALGAQETWTQTPGTDTLRVLGAAVDFAPPPLAVVGQPPIPFTVTTCARLQQRVAQAAVPGLGGHCELRFTLANAGSTPLPVTVNCGSTPILCAVVPPGQEQVLTAPAVDFSAARVLAVAANEATGGQLSKLDASAKRVFGVNLIPDPSFDSAVDGMPPRWQATSITQNARCTLAVVPGGRNGGQCLKVTCTDATGGTFGGILAWPGIAPTKVDRKFRMGCWVRTDADSVAGLQVTRANWQWWRDTERLRDKAEWTETALEFILPADTDITHVRIHMQTSRTDAELFADDTSLVELPLAPAPPP